MCGVAGLYQRDRDTRPLIGPMTDILAHRGPDGRGVWSSPSGEISLGHRRLAILDLSERAQQPMLSPSGKQSLSYNGEIYNYQELRAELEKTGWVFKSDSDTEVLLAVLQTWGLEGVSRLNGMWSFAYVDMDRGQLWLSRDRVGIKPIYYHQSAAGLIFGSEVKAILASGLVRVEVDPQGLNEYFTFQNILSDHTLFAGIKMLPAGCHGILDLKTGQWRIQRYWDFDFQSDAKMDEASATAEFEWEFERAVERHLLSDVPVGATISGGMDSSAIVSVASPRLPGLCTFTGWFDTVGLADGDRSFSEKDDARLVAKTFGTRHSERQIVWQDQVDAMAQIVWHMEDPKVGMSYTFFHISNLVSQQVTVNLSGTGGDEIFAGYPWRYSLIEQAREPAEFDREYYRAWSRVVQDSDKASFFTARAWAAMNPTGARQAFSELTSRTTHLTPVNRALAFDAKTFLHGMLMVEDKLGMAYSIEARFPFLDQHLLRVAQQIPDHLKFKDGIGKYIFRKTFEKRLPPAIVTKRKQGFTPPDLTWYRRELRGWIETMLLGHRSMSGEWIRPEAVRRVLERHDAGEDMRFQIWSLLFFEGWCRTFLASEQSPQFRTW